MKGGFMSRKSTILAVVALVAVSMSCTKQEPADPAEEAWAALGEAWNQAETAADKSTLAEDYLAKFPDSEHSGSMASAIVYYRGHEMEDPQGAYDVVSKALENIENPEQRFEVSMELLSLSDSVEVALDLAEVTGDLGAVRPLDYSEHQQVVETATDMEQWSLATEHAGAAVELATPENYRADYPDREYTDDEVAERAQRRKALSLAYSGWAQYNLGEAQKAFALFAEADEAGSVSYLGVPDTPLYKYWGRAALGEGQIDRAIELLGAETVFGEEGWSSEGYLREAYSAKNDSQDGFDEFLWATRSRLATTVDDFELLDYEGNPVRMSNVADGKVLLLAFWFPT
jgi:hypothetical protein